MPAAFANHHHTKDKQRLAKQDNQALAGQSIADADQLLLENKYKQAEDVYRSLVDKDTTGDALAGLAVALAKENLPDKILEAEKVLKEARDKFADNPNVLAAGGYVSYVHSKSVASPARRDLILTSGRFFVQQSSAR